MVSDVHVSVTDVISGNVHAPYYFEVAVKREQEPGDAKFTKVVGYKLQGVIERTPQRELTCY
jgi:hypothetical protein